MRSNLHIKATLGIECSKNGNEEANMEATYQKEQGGGVLTCECHGEHHLPDYAGDMKKILSSSARILPAGKFIGGEEVQFGGTVCYDVWYLDAENRLTHEAFSTDYEFSCPRSGGEIDGAADVKVLRYTLRPSGPRRISAKATLEAAVCLRGTAKYVCECADGEDTLHTMEKTLSVGHRIFSEPKERECGEEISLPVAYARGAEIVFSEGHVHIESAVADEGEVLVRGTYAVAVILSADGMAPLRLCESYPLEEHLPLDGCRADMEATASGFFTSLTCSVREGEGEDVALTFHGIMELAAAAEKNLSLSVVEDAFAEGGGGECENEVLSYDTFGFAESLSRTLELRVPLFEDTGTPDGVFHTAVSLKNEAYTIDGREIMYTAEAEICALCYATDASGAVHYVSQKETVPISLSLPLREMPTADAKILLEARLGMCEGRLDENEIVVAMHLCFCIRSVTEQKALCVKRITAGARESGTFVPTYSVYYPTSKDSLWTIAKRYGVSPAAIAAGNHLSAEASTGAQALPDMLLIDRRKA